MREAFEKWVCKVYDRKLQRLNEGYLDPSIDYAWMAWQASAKWLLHEIEAGTV